MSNVIKSITFLKHCPVCCNYDPPVIRKLPEFLYNPFRWEGDYFYEVWCHRCLARSERGHTQREAEENWNNGLIYNPGTFYD